MALKKCKECGHEGSKKAKACPGCGAVKKRSLLGRLIRYSLIGLVSLGVFVALLETNRVSKMTPEEKAVYDAENEQRKAERLAKKEAKATEDGSRSISRSEYLEKWPFTVEDGLLKCEAQGIVTFVTNGVEYAVNGLATASGFADIDPIWEYNEKLNQRMADSAGISLEQYMQEQTVLRINIGTVLDDGLKLCP